MHREQQWKARPSQWAVGSGQWRCVGGGTLKICGEPARARSRPKNADSPGIEHAVVLRPLIGRSVQVWMKAAQGYLQPQNSVRHTTRLASAGAGPFFAGRKKIKKKLKRQRKCDKPHQLAVPERLEAAAQGFFIFPIAVVLCSTLTINTIIY